MLIKKILFKFFILGSASFLLFKPIGINSEEIKEIEYSQNQLFTSTEKDKKEQLKSQYILDTGDVIEIIFIGIETLSKRYIINADGFIQMPEIGNLYVRGKTIDELENELINIYEPYIFQPEFDLAIVQKRTVKVFLIGEVRNAGFYQFSNKSIPNLEDVTILISDSDTPTVFDAIQAAKGVTNYADISNISVIRDNSISQGGGKIKANINLLEMIQSGDQSNNIFLRDGDTIVIPKSKKIIKDQILTINNTNLNPNEIVVFVTGNVNYSGPVRVQRGGSLVQAIASSGGKKLLTGNIEFLRFKKYGENDTRSFRYDPLAKVNSHKNPVLMDGDVINVRRSLLGNTTEILSEVGSPIFSLYGLINLFD